MQLPVRLEGKNQPFLTCREVFFCVFFAKSAPLCLLILSEILFFVCVAEMSNPLFFFSLSSTSHMVGMSSLAALTDQVWPRSDNRYSNTRCRFMGFITFNNVLQESLLFFFVCLFLVNQVVRK